MNIKYMMRCENFDDNTEDTDCGVLFTVLYDDKNIATQRYNRQVELLREDYIDKPLAYDTSACVVTLYEVKDNFNVEKTYDIIKMMRQTVGRKGCVRDLVTE